MNPVATIRMKNGKTIKIELLVKNAPNTVNSFIWAAKQGIFDNHAIERIVPGSWVDVSYSAFGREDAKYLLPFETEVNPDIELLDSKPGFVAMGGYGEKGIAGCEFFFPLRACPEHKGVYPVFGKVLEGMEEIERLEKVQTVPVTDYPDKNIEINRPVVPEIIETVEVEEYGQTYLEPVRKKIQDIPDCWK